ncbi:uncharacterized protein LOC106639607 [Copidosoma floridanum]|uniref:uncharacterized protein LOC106639607 n=1 Tax=Copidosoma floridanum TaxID=29053 RepID=UPI0006C99EB8|nr:uncharacterized protein LOC106639607 [Copidosoma floridanum]
MEGSWQWEQQREHCHKFLLGLLTHLNKGTRIAKATPKTRRTTRTKTLGTTASVERRAANEGSIGCGRIECHGRPNQQQHVGAAGTTTTVLSDARSGGRCRGIIESSSGRATRETVRASGRHEFGGPRAGAPRPGALVLSH